MRVDCGKSSTNSSNDHILINQTLSCSNMLTCSYTMITVDMAEGVVEGAVEREVAGAIAYIHVLL